MPEYLAPGVFLEEVQLKAPSIEGVSTSTTGMVGAALRGPTVGRPVLVTNLFQFRQSFGGPVTGTGMGSELYYAAQGFFANGGRRLYVVRAAGAAASAAQFATRGGFIGRLAAGADAATGQAVIRPADTMGLMDGASIQLSMLRDGVTYVATAETIAAGGINRATGAVTLGGNLDITPTGPASYAARSTAVITQLNGLDADGIPQTGARPASIVIDAADVGAAGSGIVITASPVRAARGVFVSLDGSGVDANQVRLKSASGFYVNAWVEIDRGSPVARRFRKVLAVNGPVVTLAGPALVAGDFAPDASVTETLLSVREFALTASLDGTTESFPSLTLENVTGKFVTDVINSGSRLLRINAALPADTNPFFFPSGDDGLTLTVTTAGVDDDPDAAAIRGVDNGPGQRSGLHALEEVADISIIVVPGVGEISVQEAMIEQCERLKYRVALLDPDVSGGTAPSLNDIQTQRLQFDTKYAAIYYPRIIVRDVNDANRAIGASGHMAGVCARVDNERGVFKAPGNETISNIVDIEAILTQGEHEVLNPAPNNINVIRDFRDSGRGLRIYGARCITSDNDWKYLPVRRLFVFLERSLDIGTQWAVLEPNDQRLWDKLADSVDAFLTTQWRAGALMGADKTQAFYINIGLSTMTQDDIDNGRLIMEIGVAPVKPAEFVIIRIGQWAGGSFAEEA
ncbi:phage tail sheath C-terminal domain-containing protein [Flavisphingomonas formosensis]|uniref:phage tail sheath C-terminal domain-containing protein n=1 Tax=Flavisphingomonas formosensis TaxID=861534 RepID=UPI0012FB3090|nr:phage tail sheath C-terminal domain-containing protein [Sphingomonas formosensis]